MPVDHKPSWWNPWPGRKLVRMAFPCPACFQPLVALVEPGLDLECPVCLTTFRVPAPPTPSTPKVVATVVLVQNKGHGILNQALFAIGLIVFPVGLLVVFLTGEPYFSLGVLVVFLLGLFGSRVKDYLRRRKNPEHAKLTWRGLCHEGFQAVGAVTLAVFLIPCLLCMMGPVGILLPGGW